MIRYSCIILVSTFVWFMNKGVSSDVMASGLHQSINDVSDVDSCLDYLYLNNAIPTFVFEQDRLIAESKRSEKLFSKFEFHKRYYQTDQGKRVYVTYTKADKKNSEKVNTYTFLLLNGGLLLEEAEINYPSLLYKTVDDQMYHLEHQKKHIDVGMSKEEVLNIFNVDASTYCDSVQIYDDTSRSWYYFKKDVLERIVIHQYTP